MRIVTRAEWRARTTVVDRGQQPMVRIVNRTEFFVHWLGERPAALRGSALMRWVQAFHIDSKGWADIGYNFAVDQDGTAYVGRGRDVVGAHCLDHNTSGIGVVVLIGKGEHPAAAALATVRELWQEASHAAGRVLTPLGHRDGFATECPGDELWRWVHHDLAATTAAAPVAPAVAAHHHPAGTVTQHPATVPYPGHPLSVGSRGEAVRVWQQRMAHRGWRIVVDGAYGPASANVARQFQVEKHLRVDGSVGPATWEASWAAPVT